MKLNNVCIAILKFDSAYVIVAFIKHGTDLCIMVGSTMSKFHKPANTKIVTFFDIFLQNAILILNAKSL